MYRCLYCGVYFETPAKRSHTEHAGELTFPFSEELCPICGDDVFETVDRCPDCGQYKATEHILCEQCEGNLEQVFKTFLNGLTKNQIKVLDSWLDGNWLADVKEKFKWKTK